MYIDIISVIIGMVLWELISAYIHRCIIPHVNERKRRREMETDEKAERVKRTKPASNYKGTHMGFVQTTEKESH